MYTTMVLATGLLLLLGAQGHRRASAGSDAGRHKNFPATNYVTQKVIALVFYGRRRYTTILNKYLERNLAVNNGMIDEVFFAVRTEDEDDLAFLEQLLQRHPDVYRKFDGGQVYAGHTSHGDWRRSYSGLPANCICIKIDDDVVYIQDGAIESIIREKMHRQDVLMVSANVINHPRLSYVHASMGALLPFQPSGTIQEVESWKIDQDYSAEHTLSPWQLPKETVLDDSPAGHTNYYNDLICFRMDWRCAAIAHYSFLHHLREGQLDVYKFPLFDLSYPEYRHWSINMFAFNTTDVLDALRSTSEVSSDGYDDELFLSQYLPQRLKRHCIAVGDALAVHFAYHPEEAALHRSTSLLSEYEGYNSDQTPL